MRIKRLFDIAGSLFMVSAFSYLFLISWILAVIDTRTNGLFCQERIGQFGKPFRIYKFRSMRGDSRLENQSVSKIGRFLRSHKLDELPQFINILKGEMSIVGPRPDIAGYYDLLEGEDRKILELKPGITSPAALKYFDEEALLALQQDPLDYNDRHIFPDKVQLNLAYYTNQSFGADCKIIFQTLALGFSIPTKTRRRPSKNSRSRF